MLKRGPLSHGGALQIQSASPCGAWRVGHMRALAAPAQTLQSARLRKCRKDHWATARSRASPNDQRIFKRFAGPAWTLCSTQRVVATNGGAFQRHPTERNERCQFTVRTTSDTRWVRPGQKHSRIAEVGRHGRRDSDSGRGAGAQAFIPMRPCDAPCPAASRQSALGGGKLCRPGIVVGSSWPVELALAGSWEPVAAPESRLPGPTGSLGRQARGPEAGHPSPP